MVCATSASLETGVLGKKTEWDLATDWCIGTNLFISGDGSWLAEIEASKIVSSLDVGTQPYMFFNFVYRVYRFF